MEAEKKMQRQLKKKLEAVIESGNSQHPFMEELTYPQFVDFTMRCLQGLKDKLQLESSFLHEVQNHIDVLIIFCSASSVLSRRL